MYIYIIIYLSSGAGIYETSAVYRVRVPLDFKRTAVSLLSAKFLGAVLGGSETGHSHEKKIMWYYKYFKIHVNIYIYVYIYIYKY